MGRLSGKVAIITGAASGMGLAAAQLFAREDAKVVACDITVDVLEKEVAQIEGDVIAVGLDVSNADQWATVLDTTLEHYGKVDILINNAGIWFPAPLLTVEKPTWDKIIAVDLEGVFLGMKTVIPFMQTHGGGSIVNCSSIAGILGGDADGHNAAYSAAKGGVRSLTKHAAQQYAQDNIRVNSVHPGVIYTGMVAALGATYEQMKATPDGNTPLAPGVGEPFDIAYGYLYLASDEAKFVTGSELVIDGGFISH